MLIIKENVLFSWENINRQELWNKSGVYSFVNKINNKRYIGISNNIYSRLMGHLGRFNKGDRNHAIYLAFNKYGLDNFYIEILEFCDRDKLFDKEIYYIDKYKTFKGKGYNMTQGGENGGYGENSHNSVLTQKQADQIRREYNKGIKMNILAEEYGVGDMTICEIVNGLRYLDSEYANNYNKKKKNYNGLNTLIGNFNKKEVVEIRKLYKEGINQNKIAKEFNTTKTTINEICLNKTYCDENYKQLTRSEIRLLKCKMTIEDLKEVKRRYNNGETWLGLEKDYHPTRKTLKSLVIDILGGVN